MKFQNILCGNDGGKMGLSLFSKYRKQIMGLAIFLIIICHNTIVFPDSINVVNEYIKCISQCGVDIFLILSGMGIYYSLNKSFKISSFYKKRATRIFIPYIFVVLLYGLFCIFVRKESITMYLYKMSPISFFLGGWLIEWFVAAIIVLYAISPLLYKLLYKSNFAFLILIVITVMFCIVGDCVLKGARLTVNSIFVSRIPAYLVGMFLGKLILKSNYKLKNKRIIQMGLILILCAIIWCVYSHVSLSVVRMIFLPLSVCIIANVCIILENTSKIDKQFFGDKALLFLGGITFEVYLFHEKFLDVFGFYFQYDKNTVFSVIVNILAVVLSIVSAKLLHRIERIVIKTDG